jgi:LuxR family maltose regulon positive regulatory protein
MARRAGLRPVATSPAHAREEMVGKQPNEDRQADEINILSTKLSPPRLHAIVARERLLLALDRSESARLTTIVAGAGFGKSTLAADFLRQRGHPHLWYQLEDTDRDLSVFTAYLEAAMAEQAAVPGEAVRSATAALGAHGEDHRPALALLLSQMESRLGSGAYIVLDDFQEVNDSPEVIDALDFILAHLPLNLHLIILSSCELSLDLSRLRARREVVEVPEEQIRFTAEETSRLFSEVFALQVEADEITSLTDLAEGWITGLVLLSHAMSSGESGLKTGLAGRPGMPTSQVFDYFYRVIYLRMDEPCRDFLLRTSILTRVEAGFCDELLGSADSRAMLSYLAASHLFIIPLDEAGNSYRFHFLLNSFLRGLLESTLLPSEICDLHARAAALWEARGESEEALRHYLEAGDFRTAGELMEDIADALMKANRITFVLETMLSFPHATLHDHPKLAHTLARCQELLGHYRQALEIYREAATVFSARGDVAASMDCLRSALKLSILSGVSADAGKAVAEFVKIFEGVAVEPDSWYESAALLSVGSAYLGLTEWAHYFLAASLSHVEDIWEESVRITMLNWCGYVSLLLGDYVRASDLLEQACILCEGSGYISSLPDICCLLAFSLVAMGEYAEAREAAEKGLRLGTVAGGEGLLPPGMLQNRLARAICLAVTGDGDEALRELEYLCGLAEGSEDSWLAINCNLFTGTTYLDAGDVRNSLRYFRKTEVLCREKGFVDDRLLSRLSQIALTVGERDADEIREEAHKILGALQERAAGGLRSPSYLLLASIHYQLGDEDAAQEALSSAVAIDEVSKGLGWWRAYSRLVLPVMAAAFSRGEHLDFLSHAFRSIGAPSLPYLHRAKKSAQREVKARVQELIKELTSATAEPLKITMLGSFTVAKGDARIEEPAWRSRRALNVLKYLAAHHRGGPLQRDVIMELLWPEMSSDRASKNLNVALSTVRKTLDPEADWGDSQYLVSSGNSLRLSLGEGGWIDLEVFEARLEEAERARIAGDDRLYLSKLLEAESIYGGDFLTEDLYEDWCVPMRESLRRAYFDLLRDIADQYLGAGDSDKALARVERALEGDPGWEELYRRLMTIHAARGDRAGVERAFESCRRYLEEHFEVTPSPETLELLEELRNRVQPH